MRKLSTKKKKKKKKKKWEMDSIHRAWLEPKLKIHHAKAAFEDKGLNVHASKWIQSAIIIPKAIYGSVACASHDLTTKETTNLRTRSILGLYHLSRH